MARLGLVALAAAAALAVAGVAAWLLVLRDTADPATVGSAVSSFRDETESRPDGSSPVPEGVYVYETEGRERTDALTGVTHRYPARSTVTVTRHPCGVRMRWDVLEGRSTTWTFCVSPAGWTLESQDERHTFFGRTERTTYACSDSLFRPAGDRAGAAFPLTCAAGRTNERGTARVVGHEQVRVGDVEVEAVHLARTSTFSGGTRGSSSHHVWLDRERGVPVRVRMESETTNASPIGDVRYEEHVVLRLTSLAPRR